jgi:hypothetical protein
MQPYAISSEACKVAEDDPPKDSPLHKEVAKVVKGMAK